jgi:HlyD family secretion protein
MCCKCRSARFSARDEWAVFAVKDRRTRAVPVEMGQRTSRIAEVISGLPPGDQVVLHPSDRVVDGTRVTERQTR